MRVRLAVKGMVALPSRSLSHCRPISARKREACATPFAWFTSVCAGLLPSEECGAAPSRDLSGWYDQVGVIRVSSGEEDSEPYMRFTPDMPSM